MDLTERGILADLMSPTADEDAACRHLLRNLRAFTGRWPADR